MSKEHLFSLTEKDFEFKYSRGSGKGGQKRNKTSSKVHCKHVASGASVTCDETRCQHQNKRIAFKRLVSTPQFQAWMKIEIAKASGKLKDLEDKVNKSMKYIKVQVKSENGTWIDAGPELIE